MTSGIVTVVCLWHAAGVTGRAGVPAGSVGVRGQFVKTVLPFKDLFLRIEGIAQGLVSLPVFMSAVLQSRLQYFDFVS